MREIVIRLIVPDGVEVRIDDVPASQLPPPQETPVVRTIATEPQSVTWQPGQIHAQGHNPLKGGPRGIFCPTKLGDGTWCRFHA